MNIASGIHNSGWNASQTGTVKTTPQHSGKTAALPHTEQEKRCQTDSFVRTTPENAVQSAEKECPKLQREDPVIQEVLDKMSGGKTVLSEESLKYLTEKYDATRMTEEEYKAFTNDLKEMGILNETERGAVDSELQLCRLPDYLSQHLPHVIYTERRHGSGPKFSDNWHGNALAWTKYRSSARSYYDDIGGYDINWNSSVFTVVHSVLEQMDAAEHSSV